VVAQKRRFFMDKNHIFRLKLTSYVAWCDDGCHAGDIFHLIRSFRADAGKVKMPSLGIRKKQEE
jgi:hypothetical protein